MQLWNEYPLVCSAEASIYLCVTIEPCTQLLVIKFGLFGWNINSEYYEEDTENSERQTKLKMIDSSTVVVVDVHLLNRMTALYLRLIVRIEKQGLKEKKGEKGGASDACDRGTPLRSNQFADR